MGEYIKSKIGFYISIICLLCLVPNISALKTPMEYGNDLLDFMESFIKVSDADLEVKKIRSDGAIIVWDLTGAWVDTYNYNITLTSLMNKPWIPWYGGNCSENYNCMSGPCQIDTKNIGKCTSVGGCETARITVTGTGIHKQHPSANVEIVTGPSNGKIVGGHTTPNYTPSLRAETDSDDSIIVSWFGPGKFPDSICAKKALIKTRVDGKAYKNRDIVKEVKFRDENKVKIKPDGLRSDKQSLVEITVAYMVEVNGEYKATDVQGYVSTKIGVGGQIIVSSSPSLVVATVACILFSSY